MKIEISAFLTSTRPPIKSCSGPCRSAKPLVQNSSFIDMIFLDPYAVPVKGDHPLKGDHAMLPATSLLEIL